MKIRMIVGGGALMLLASLMMTDASRAQAQQSEVEDQVFLEVLERCLGQPRTTLQECAKAAAIATETPRLEVKQQISLPDSEADPLAGTVYQCNPDHSVCKVFDCGQTDSQSYCTLVAYCTSHNELADRSYCSDESE